MLRCIHPPSRRILVRVLHHIKVTAMREIVHWQEVSCGSCGETLSKHKALFAKTGVRGDYRCWRCDVKENSPSLSKELSRVAPTEAAVYDPEDSIYSVLLSTLWPLVGVQIVKILLTFGFGAGL
jgi:hypothetical protein